MPSQLLMADPYSFKLSFPEKPFILHHQLAKNPLLHLPRLIELSLALKGDSTIYSSGPCPSHPQPSSPLQSESSLAQSIQLLQQHVQAHHAWLGIKNIENDPTYREFLYTLLTQIEPLTSPHISNMHQRSGQIVISAPGACTPFCNMQRHGFVLQIRGSNTIHVWDQHDRSVISEQDLEACHTEPMHRLKYLDEFAIKAESFTLKAGAGVHLPLNAPHWSQNGDEISIALYLNFNSDLAARCERLYQINSKLRRLGLRPTPVGRSAWRDYAKDSTYRTLQGARRLLIG